MNFDWYGRHIGFKDGHHYFQIFINKIVSVNDRRTKFGTNVHFDIIFLAELDSKINFEWHGRHIGFKDGHHHF